MSFNWILQRNEDQVDSVAKFTLTSTYYLKIHNSPSSVQSSNDKPDNKLLKSFASISKHMTH